MLADRRAHETQRLEHQGKLTSGFTAYHYPRTPREQAEARRIWAAMLLTDNVDAFIALIHGRQVPQHHIRPRYLQLHQARAA